MRYRNITQLVSSPKLRVTSQSQAASSSHQASSVNEINAKIPIGRKGNPINALGNNTPSKINGRNFTGHALDQMQGRGVTPSVIENAIKNGLKSPGNTSGTTVHVFDNVKVVTNTGGDVVTVILR